MFASKLQNSYVRSLCLPQQFAKNAKLLLLFLALAGAHRLQRHPRLRLRLPLLISPCLTDRSSTCGQRVRRVRWALKSETSRTWRSSAHPDGDAHSRDCVSRWRLHAPGLREGRNPHCEWLNLRGITAFVLTYRLSPRYHYPAPILDGAKISALGAQPRAGIQYCSRPYRHVGFSAADTSWHDGNSLR